MSRRVSIIFMQGLLMFSFMETSILTIMYGFCCFLVFKLYKSGQQIIHLILDQFIFLHSVDSGGYLVVAYFER